MKRLLALLLSVALVCACFGAASAQTLQDCHRVTLTKTDTTQSNKSVIRVWSAETAHSGVTAELAAIQQEYVDRLGPDLPKAANSTAKNSRLDVEIRYSRTGLTWMSFVIQARTTYHRALTGQELTTRTYDMTTGHRILLTDIFPEGSPAWSLLQEAVRAKVTEYFPKEQPDEALLDQVCSLESIRQMDFSLHGMSLVLHLRAQDFYPKHFTLIEVPLYYPQLRPYMTPNAQIETDNTAYYKTIAITFDDGPSRTNTTNVLNALMEAGIPGTFFVVGNRISENADLVQREHDEGHAVASHNWHHGTPSKSKPTALRAMPKKVNDAMNKAIGIPVRYDRVPYGLYNTMIKAKVGWAYIQWSVDTYDWRGRSVSAIVNKVVKEASDGDIILCHDIKDNTAKATLQIADKLAEKGFIFLTVDEMFAKDGVELKPDHVYYRCVDGETGLKK